MPSSNDFAARALRLLGVLQPGESPSSEDGELAFDVLNDWIDELGTERDTIYFLARTTKTLASSTASYTIGSGGDINIVRPVWIERAGLILDTSATDPVEATVHILTDTEYSSIGIKGLESSLTSAIWYDHNWAAGLGKIYVFPIPDVGTTQLVLYTPTALTEFADQSTNYTFPPAYRQAITFNLANLLAPFYPSQRPDPRVETIAKSSLAKVKRANLRLRTLQVALAGIGSRSGTTMRQSQFVGGA